MFAGICVGGPLAGQRLGHDAPIYKIVKSPFREILLPPPGVAMSIRDMAAVAIELIYKFDPICKIWWYEG